MSEVLLEDLPPVSNFRSTCIGICFYNFIFALTSRYTTAQPRNLVQSG